MMELLKGAGKAAASTAGGPLAGLALGELMNSGQQAASPDSIGAGIVNALSQPQASPMSMEGLALLSGLGPVAPIDLPLPPAKNDFRTSMLDPFAFKMRG